MLYWKEIIDDLAKILTWFCSTWFKVYMTKLQMFCVWAFCHMTIVYFVFTVPCIIIYSLNNQQMQLFAVNFIPLPGSLYMFRVFYTPIIRVQF